MSEYPEVTNNYFTERDGIIQVQAQLNLMKLIFRETPNADVGIDGQIEYVDESGVATGKIIAVQIKSGISHVREHDNHWAYYPSEKHRNYWERFPLPVFLMIYLPAHKATFFVDARHVLNIPNYAYKYLAIPKQNILAPSAKHYLFETHEALNEPFLTIDEVLLKMASTRNPNPTFSMSFLDLFSFGLINISRQVFFCMSLATELAELSNETEWGMGVGETDHYFLHAYARFLMSQNLAKIDYADYLIDWKERLIHPMFIAPLTNRGRQLLEIIANKEQEFFGDTKLTRERLIGMVNSFYDESRLHRANMLATKLTASKV